MAVHYNGYRGMGALGRAEYGATERWPCTNSS